MRARLDRLTAEAARAGAAIGAYTCYELATADAIIAGAERVGLPVVLLVPPTVAQQPRGMRFISTLRMMADAAAVGVVVQLDHATDPTLIRQAVDAGADAVLADGSRLGIMENAAFVSAQLASIASQAVVEAELGALPGDEDRAGLHAASADSLTDPSDAERFVDMTGVPLLAVSIGNVHGAYRGTPRIDHERLRSIRERGAVPLVLHGASGIPAHDLRAAIDHGVAKVNINTELRGRVLDVWSGGLDAARRDGDNVAALSRSTAEAATAFVAESLASLRSGAAPLPEGNHIP